MKRVVTLAIVALATPARAAPPAPAARTISLAEVQKLARERGFAERRAGAAAAVGHAEHAEARWRLAPTLIGQVGYGGIDGATVSTQTGVFDRARYTTATPFLRVGYSFNPIAGWYDSVVAGRRAGALDAATAVAARDTTDLVDAAYFELTFAVAQQHIAAQALGDANDVLRLTQAIARGGNTTEDSIARAQTEVATAQLVGVEAERRSHDASIRLASALDLDVGQRLTPTDAELATRPSDADPQARNRPEIAVLVRQLAATNADRDAAWAAILAPRIDVYVEEGALGPDFASDKQRLTAGLALTWILSGTALAHVRTTTARIAAAELAVADIRHAVTAEVATARVDLRAARDLLAPAEAALSAAEDAFRLVTARFRNGDALLFEVIDAQRAVEQARLQQLGTRIGAVSAHAHLDLVLGD